MSNQSPLHVLVLPKGRSPDAVIATLAHPRTTQPSRYFIDPAKGVYQFTSVSAHKNLYRSWLLTPAPREADSKGQERQEFVKHGRSSHQAQSLLGSSSTVISKPDLLVANPIDPLFLMIPSLFGPPGQQGDSKRLFLSCEDVLDKVCGKSRHFEQIISNEWLRCIFENRLRAICDIVQAGGESMYRLNEAKLLAVMVDKAGNIESVGLPRSMEDKFLKRALDVPVSGIEEGLISEHSLSQIDAPSTALGSSIDSQESAGGSGSSSFSISAATDVTTPDECEVLPIQDLQRLLRIRTILSYIMSSYFPVHAAKSVESFLTSPESPINFKPLEKRLALISKVRAEALAARSLGDFSRKRSAYEDDELAAARAEKKRKKVEEEKGRKLQSRGIKELQKVDTRSMKKMSEFFGKKAVTKE